MWWWRMMRWGLRRRVGVGEWEWRGSVEGVRVLRSGRVFDGGICAWRLGEGVRAGSTWRRRW
ncbi:hypothetical protein, partial [Cellulosimicrobium sp. TH-20]|uniref:hypothetical protein n=1 Tax=Cellulosimicrobium sp. TH-20 TaxID=1980001 RepID=UPI001C993433